VRHCELCKTGRSDGQEVHAPLSSGVEQVPHEGEQGRQVPFIASVLNGQLDIHCPSEAKVLSGQRVQVVADVMQDRQESSHPARQLLLLIANFSAHVGMFHSSLLYQEVGRNPRSKSSRISQIQGGTHHDTPNKSTIHNWRKAKTRVWSK
jgi:hypothetical protein